MRALIRSACGAAFLGLAGPAFAQVDSYRPGGAYLSNPSPSPDACVAQCAGDAGCRSWNWVRVRDSGVCELNSTDSTPIPSRGAVSGTAPGTSLASNRLVRVPGSRTVRIGQPEAPKAPATRRVVRDAPPARLKTRPAAVTPAPRPAAAPSPRPMQRPAQPVARRPAFSHSLDAQPQARPVRPTSPQLMQRPALPPAPAAPRPVPTPRPVLQTQPEPAALQTVAPPPPPTHQLRVPMTAAAAQDSLFGSLYDDVSVPAPADAGALSDPDAPVATAKSVPVAPVRSETLPGLAGG